ERPHFDQAEKMEFPTEAWACQDFRKANVLRLAAGHAAEPLRSRLQARGHELADRAWQDLLHFGSRTVARAMAIMMIEGLTDCRLRSPVPSGPPPTVEEPDFGQPETLVSQRRRVKQMLRSPAGWLRLASRLANPARWLRVRWKR